MKNTKTKNVVAFAYLPADSRRWQKQPDLILPTMASWWIMLIFFLIKYLVDENARRTMRDNETHRNELRMKIIILLMNKQKHGPR